MPIKLKNNVAGFLATTISASDTGLVLQSGNGAAFPTLAAADYCYATLISTGGTIEIVKITARAGDALTVVRAQEGTSATGFAAGTRVELRITAQAVYDAGAATGVSVKSYGAVGDGIADDAPAIRATIAAAIAGGGGVVFFPKGTYRLASGATVFYAIEIANTSNISLVGESPFLTTLRVADGSRLGPISLVSSTGIQIFGMTIDGNAANQSPTQGVHGIRSDNCDDIFFRDLVVRNSQGYGLGFQGNNDYRRVFIDTVEIIDAGDDGCDFKNRAFTNEALVFNNVIVRNHSQIQTGKAGIDIRGPATLNNIHVFCKDTGDVVGIRFRQSVTTSGGNGVGGRNSSLSNFYIDLAGVAGSNAVVVDDPRVSVSNGNIINCSGVGVWLTGNSNNCSVSNVQILAASSGGGLHFELGLDSYNNSLVNCNVLMPTGNTGHGFRINGTNCTLTNCTSEGGDYGFRRSQGTTTNYLVNCASTGAATTDFGTSGGEDKALNCRFSASNITQKLVSGNGDLAMIFPSVPGAVDAIAVRGSVAGGDGPVIHASGDSSVAQLNIASRQGSLNFITDGTTPGAHQALELSHNNSVTAEAFVRIVGNAQGVGPFIGVGPTAGNPLRIASRSGPLHLLTSGDTPGTNEALRIQHVLGAVNYFTANGSLTGQPCELGTAGSDTTVDLYLNPKGAGYVQFGAHTGTADAPVTGYITVKDDTGTLRKLAVIT